MTPAETLSHIAGRLADTSPTDLIDELMPGFPIEALTWARRLSHWDEFRGQFSDQAIGVARVVSRRAMREFGLAISDDGCVVDFNSRPVKIDPKPELTFTLRIAEQPVQVAYTRSYFARDAKDAFDFSAEKNPLSESGFWHTFVPQDAVEALGGPQAFAARCAEAKLAGQEKEFMEGFEGRTGEKPKRKPVGRHTAKVEHKPEAGRLF
jgi:hypothetical protein